jgi:hypothetical protein
MPYCIVLLFAFHLNLNFKFKFKALECNSFSPSFPNWASPTISFSFSSLFSSLRPSPTWPFSSPSSPPARPSWPSFFSFSSPAQAQPSSFFLPPPHGLLFWPSPPAQPASSPLPPSLATGGPHLSGPSSSPRQARTRVRVRSAPGAILRRVDLGPSHQDPRGHPI